MNPPNLGEEIRRLRLRAEFTLRGLAADLGVSAAHLSDIEHNRRRPSERLLRKIADRLKSVGATYDSLEQLISGIDTKTREWAASTPGARALLRLLLEAGRDPQEIHRALEKLLGPKRKGKGARVVNRAAASLPERETDR
jgi:transcriptional regulator with XRE-family HTH domain